jgi:protein arginine kinase activator
MNCERCQKNHATLHLTAMELDQKPREIHLCEECARQTGVTLKFNFPVNEILGTLFPEPKTSGKTSQLRCPECGITYSEFKSKARLGCANDYEVFQTELLRLFKKVHDATTHTGKTPCTVEASVRKENELMRLKRDLESVVKSEDFEKAAQIRDRIRSLELDLNR